jgi:hypothetical protein
MKTKLIILLLPLLAFISCKPVQTITTNTAQSNTIQVDTVYKPLEVIYYLPGEVNTVTRDSIVYVTIPGTPTNVNSYSPDVTKYYRANIDPVTAKTTLATANARVINSKIELQLIQHDTLIKQKFDSLNLIIHYKNQLIEKSEVNSQLIKTQNSRFARFSIWYFIATLIAAATYVYIKFIKL